MLAIFLTLFDFVGQDAVLLACALVDLALVPCTLAFSLELVAAGAEFGDGLFREKLLKCPLLNVLLLILLELGDELNCPLEDGALVLLAAWHDLGELVDTLVDGLPATAFDCK